MEESHKSPVETSTESSGSENNANEITSEVKEDLIPYSTYSKALKEKRNYMDKVNEYEAKLKAVEEEKLAREGNLGELAETYKTRAANFENELKETRKTFAWEKLTDTIKNEATRNGCSNPDKLIKLMDDDDFKTIEMDEDFKVNINSVKQVIEKSKKENYFLFSNSTKQIVDGNPITGEPLKKNKTEEEMLQDYIKNLK